MNEENTLKVHTYAEYRVFTRLEYLTFYGCYAYPKSDHKIASVDAIVYSKFDMFLFQLSQHQDL